MNKNTKALRAKKKYKFQPRKSEDEHPKVGYPNKPDALRGPSIREQMEILGWI